MECEIDRLGKAHRHRAERIMRDPQFGEWVRRAREDLGWTQDDLSAAGDVSLGTIRALETDAPDAVAPGEIEGIRRTIELAQREQRRLEEGHEVIRREMLVHEYASPQELEADTAWLGPNGWTVVTTTKVRPRTGWRRLVLVGWLVRLWPPKPRLVVTWERIQTITPPPPGQRVVVPPPLPDPFE
jgi:transcriptional regulator with XRE-family HTH domain